MVLHTFHLFAGAGGGILADLLLGHIPVGAVEIDPYCRETLLARQADLILPRFPIWDDVRTFRSDNPECLLFIDRLRGIAGQLAICGGPPCQPFSVAGKKLAEKDGRNMWPEMDRIIREIKPQFVLFENVPGIRRYLRQVIRDLRRNDYEVGRPLILGADDVGAIHKRKRVWIFAYFIGDELRNTTGGIGRKKRENKTIPRDDGEERAVTNYSSPRFEIGDISIRSRQPLETEADTLGNSEDVSDTDSGGFKAERPTFTTQSKHEAFECSNWWEIEPGVGRVVNGMANRVGRIKGLGNGQVPFVAAMAWRILYNRLFPSLTDKA